MVTAPKAARRVAHHNGPTPVWKGDVSMPNNKVTLENCPPIVEDAVKLLRSTKSAERKSAVETLAQTDDQTARDALKSAVKYRVQDVRVHAAFMLVQFRDSRDVVGLVVPGLIEALHDKDSVIGENVARALRKIVDENVVALYDSVWVDTSTLVPQEDWTVRKAALWTLVQIGAEAVPALRTALRSPLHNGSVEVVMDIAQVIEQIGPPAVPGLIDDLRDEDQELRKFAVPVLASIGAAAVPGLIDILEDEQEDVNVRLAAFQALEMTNTGEALEACEKWESQISQAAGRLKRELGSRRLGDGDRSSVDDEQTEYVDIECEHDKEQTVEASEIYVPKGEKKRSEWKQAYHIIVRLREEYRERYLDGETSTSKPSPNEIIQTLLDEMNLAIGEKTVNRIIKAGKAGLLRD
jgi:hypothetical protein